MAALAEKRRQLPCAILTEISVLQLAVSEKPDLFSADIAVFFVKQPYVKKLLLFFALMRENCDGFKMRVILQILLL